MKRRPAIHPRIAARHLEVRLLAIASRHSARVFAARTREQARRALDVMVREALAEIDALLDPRAAPERAKPR